MRLSCLSSEAATTRDRLARSHQKKLYLKFTFYLCSILLYTSRHQHTFIVIVAATTVAIVVVSSAVTITVTSVIVATCSGNTARKF
jgi:hypothetical protein